MGYLLVLVMMMRRVEYTVRGAYMSPLPSSSCCRETLWSSTGLSTYTVCIHVFARPQSLFAVAVVLMSAQAES